MERQIVLGFNHAESEVLNAILVNGKRLVAPSDELNDRVGQGVAEFCHARMRKHDCKNVLSLATKLFHETPDSVSDDELCLRALLAGSVLCDHNKGLRIANLKLMKKTQERTTSSMIEKVAEEALECLVDAPEVHYDEVKSIANIAAIIAFGCIVSIMKNPARAAMEMMMLALADDEDDE